MANGTSGPGAAHDVPVRVDHVGIAVRSVADAEPVLLALGAEKLQDETVGDRFRWVYYRLGDASRVELIEPIAEDTFLTAFLDEHGPGFHHVTLEVADVAAVAAGLEDAGLRVVDHREHDTYSEAFVSPRNPTGALFQLMEYHDGYAEGRGAPGELFVNGRAVEAAYADGRPPGAGPHPAATGGDSGNGPAVGSGAGAAGGSGDAPADGAGNGPAEDPDDDGEGRP